MRRLSTFLHNTKPVLRPGERQEGDERKKTVEMGSKSEWKQNRLNEYTKGIATTSTTCKRVGGEGGGLIAFCRLLPVASSLRHAHDDTLYRSSLAIFDTLMRLRSIDLLLQSLTRS